MIDYVRFRDKERKSREGTGVNRSGVSFSNGLKNNIINKQTKITIKSVPALFLFIDTTKPLILKIIDAIIK